MVGPRANGLSCLWRKRRERFGEKVHTWVPLPRLLVTHPLSCNKA